MAVTPVVAIIGRPNVGKSSLFNRLVGRRQAIVDYDSGTTRDCVRGEVSWQKHNFRLLDTAGLEKPKQDLEISIQEQIKKASETSDLILVVIDAGSLITDKDIEAAKMALRLKKPIILVLNKIDTASQNTSDNYLKLGIKEVAKVSAIHGTGTGDLLDLVVQHLPKVSKIKELESIKIALLGRPNVGKSSIFNQLSGQSNAVISDTPGTTRDVNMVDLNYKGTKFEIFDTAGIRKSGQIRPGIEKFSFSRTLASIQEADIGVVILDALEPGTAVDQKIAGMVTKEKRGLILVVNKWDLGQGVERPKLEAFLRKTFQFAWWSPLLFTSAVTGVNITKILELAIQIYAKRKLTITTSKLNSIVEAALIKQLPTGLKNKKIHIKYATQTGTEPPTFTFFTNHPESIHFSYRRYLENTIRQAEDFNGTPIKIEFRLK